MSKFTYSEIKQRHTGTGKGSIRHQQKRESGSYRFSVLWQLLCFGVDHRRKYSYIVRLAACSSDRYLLWMVRPFCRKDKEVQMLPSLRVGNTRYDVDKF